ncbi:hypothetical protein [Gimesia maris]|uniref:hypothetical protein n=1 Tax=Gimesia maris TaxID=122 RepID=UPI0030DC3FF6|tara:strand:+ start:378 stop:815 length:438 start_codon:yes stop_codon:yes gene_type:complete
MAYNNKLKAGEAFQDFVKKHIQEQLHIPINYYTSKEEQYNIGESKQGIEVKLDNRCTETGRLSIEIAEKTKAQNKNFIPSGIFRQDNTWLYLQGNYDMFFIFSKKVLQRFYYCNKPDIHELPTIRKFYLPIPLARILAEKIICPT